jgi:hypothetical protein
LSLKKTLLKPQSQLPLNLMNVNISVNAIWIITFDMKHPKMFLLKWNVIIGVKGYSIFKPTISNQVSRGTPCSPSANVSFTNLKQVHTKHNITYKFSWKVKGSTWKKMNKYHNQENL